MFLWDAVKMYKLQAWLVLDDLRKEAAETLVLNTQVIKSL